MAQSWKVLFFNIFTAFCIVKNAYYWHFQNHLFSYSNYNHAIYNSSYCFLGNSFIFHVLNSYEQKINAWLLVIDLIYKSDCEVCAGKVGFWCYAGLCSAVICCQSGNKSGHQMARADSIVYMCIVQLLTWFLLSRSI